MIIIYSERCLEYHYPGHPESPKRIAETAALLKSKNFKWLQPSECTDEDILRVHTPLMLHQVKTEAFLDFDTPAIPFIETWARLSAGAAVLACQKAWEGSPAFSLMRPPGHHASKSRIMGFCYLNNMAIAVARFLSEYPGKKAAILDIDAHHGNGTEDIFLNHPDVRVVSIHQMPLFPGTGRNSAGSCINIPLPPGTKKMEYLCALDKAVHHILLFDPDILGVSVGFDTCAGDPLAHFELDVHSFGPIACKISSINKPAFFVLEGGYNPEMPKCAHTFFKRFAK